jgi:hypothetical protein
LESSMINLGIPENQSINRQILTSIIYNFSLTIVIDVARERK